MAASTEPQTSIYETEIQNPELLDLLERRQTLRDQRSKLNAKLREIDTVASVKIEELDLADAPVRLGRFLLTPKSREAASRSFEIPAKDFVQISLLDT